MKVLILVWEAGEETKGVGEAVRDEVISRAAECDIVDVADIAEGKLAGGKRRADDKSIGRKASVSVTNRAPKTSGTLKFAGQLWNAAKMSSALYMSNAAGIGKIKDFIDKGCYDCVVCTHLCPMQILTWFKKKGELNIPCCGVLTDYICMPFVNETEMDAYFLPSEEVRQECIEKGMKPELLHVTGLPVSEKFVKPMTKLQARNYLVIPGSRKMYLVMMGSAGYGNAIGLCDELLATAEEDIAVYVLVGRNSELRERIDEKYSGDARVHAVTFTQIVNIYMKAADVLIAKPCGITSTEAATTGVPLVHTEAIPGREMKNAQLFDRLGMSYYAKTIKDAAREAHILASNAKMSDKMLDAQRLYVTPFGARNVADFVMA